MSVNKEYCMSSYLTFRYIEKDGVDFYPGMHHVNPPPLSQKAKTFVRTADDIDAAIKEEMEKISGKKKGIMLSGGMDSAIIASYMSECGGGDAYTFRFLGGKIQKEELTRAEYYAARYGLKLHYVDISWQTVLEYLDLVMAAKCAPVHSIEPQIFQAAQQAKEDGVELMLLGEGADVVFGGLDQLLSKDWKFDDFKKRYTFTDPKVVLTDPVSVDDVFERYRKDGDKIDFLSFMSNIYSTESSGSYVNAFSAAGMEYFAPYTKLKMADPLDLYRVRNGESKYLIRELMHKKYPEIPVPNKLPMPRPLDAYFQDWSGPKRPEFKKNLSMSDFTGNQKWQMYCLERFFNNNE